MQRSSSASIKDRKESAQVNRQADIQVDSTKYYEACVHDVCACDSGGDCECFCTAVAAYAQACRDVGVCLSWRTPDICPLFCDYYNPQGECEWHYQPCGAPCLKTCRNPTGHCLVDLPGLEGCYPQCPPSQPFFNEDQMKCVAECGCYDDDGNYHDIGTEVPTTENCQSCLCTPGGLKCVHNLTACTCTYEGRTYRFNDVVYNTTDGLGACLVAICKDNGTIIRTAEECPEVLSTTPFTFTSTLAPSVTTGSASTVSTGSTVSTVCVREVCHWSIWYDESYPEPGTTGGEFETLENLRRKGYQVCQTPAAIQCRAKKFPNMDLQELGQKVNCDPSSGLKCLNSEQSPPLCYNYELRVLCCEYVPCSSSLTSGPRTTHSQPDTSTQTASLLSKSTPSWTTERKVISPDMTHSSRQTVAVTSKTRMTSHPTVSRYWVSTLPMSRPTWTTIVKESTLHTTLSSQPTSVLTSQTRANSTASMVTHTVSSPVTSTTCQPRCQWTKWFDTDYPTSDREGGDIETYDQIRATGAEICEQPQDIQCVAQNYLDMSLDMLDQKVQCDVNFGLVCHNRDQKDPFGMCLNYMVRVLCCSASHCQGPATTAGSPPPPGTVTTATQTLSSIPQPTTTRTVTSTHSAPTTVATSLKTLPGSGHTATLVTSSASSPPHVSSVKATSSPGTISSIHTTVNILPKTLQPSVPALTTKQTSSTEFWTTILTSTAGTVSSKPPPTSLALTTGIKELSTNTPRTQTPPVTVTNATTSQGTTHCQPKCKWTEWFDVDFPSSGEVRGDIETYENIRASGKKVCQAPEKIECRAENYPAVSIDKVGQVVNCSLETGLVCKNKDQTDDFKMCFNYNIRVLCCDDYSHCPSTTAVPPTSTMNKPKVRSEVPTLATSSSTGQGHSTKATTSSKTAQSMMTNTIHTGSTHSVSSPMTSTSCQPRCQWTKWFDTDYPTSDREGGDIETYDQIRATGAEICEQPQDIQCVAQNYLDMSLDMLDQKVQCDVNFGLVCHNRDQKDRFGMCLNYMVRVLCCSASHCQGPATTAGSPPPPGTVTTATSRSVTHTSWLVSNTPTSTSTTESISSPSKTTGLTTASSTATPRETQTPSRLTTGLSSTLTTTRTSSTGCKFQCTWTDWLDSGTPQHGQFGGDIETYYHIRNKTGIQICKTPVDIECEAILFPNMSFQQLGQEVVCNVDFGLICRNSKQSNNQTCLNYHIRVLCCEEDISCSSTTGSLTTTSSQVTKSPTTAGPLSSTSTSEPAFSSTVSTSTSQWPSEKPIPSTSFTTLRRPSSPKMESVVSRASTRTSESFPVSSLSTLSASPTSFPQTSKEPHSGKPTTTSWTASSNAPGTSMTTSTGTSTEFSRTTTTPRNSLPTSTSPTSTRSIKQNSTFMTTTNPQTLIISDISKSHSVLPSSTHITTTSSATDTSMELVTETYSSTSLTSPGPSHSHPGSTTMSSATAVSTTKATTSSKTAQSMMTNTIHTGSTHSVSSPMTSTSCQPRCQWTKWFDTDYPTSDREGGDIETYDQIRATGAEICEQPQDIQCVAQNYLDMSLDMLDQKVQCDVNFGLVCHNRDQKDPFGMCLNYMVRVLCCSASHCQGPATTAGSPPPPGTVTTATQTLSSIPQPTTTRTVTSTHSAPTTVATSLKTLPGSGHTATLVTSSASSPPHVSSVKATSSPGTISSIHTTVNILPKTLQPSVPALTTKQTSSTEFWTTILTSTAGTVSSKPPPTSLTLTTGIKELSTNTPRTQTPPVTVTNATTSQGTTHCQPKCKWTEWFDVDSPTSGEVRGDIETYENIRASGKKVCQAPEKIECRAENYPAVSIDKVGQVVNCSLETGLVCKNKDQTDDFKMCFNYNIRVLCCDDYSHCPSTTAVPPTSTMNKPKVRSEVPTLATSSSTGQGHSTKATTSSKTAQSIMTNTIHTGSTHSVSSPMTSTSCQPRCQWTKWFDTDYPTSDREGGDIETYDQIRATGAEICEQPQDIQCVAQNYLDMTLDMLDQKVQCDVNFGLVCYNRDQKDRFGMCLNYMVRVLCCSASHCQGPATTAGSPPPPGTVTTARLSSTVINPSTSFRSTSATSTPTSSPKESQPLTLLSTRTTGISTRLASSMVCKPRCTWTDWLDQHSPIPGSSGGEFETYDSLRAAGIAICEKPLDLECDIVDQPNVPREELRQVVNCSLDFGLVCRNVDQPGPFSVCLNHRIRVLCCDDYSHCSSTPSSTIKSALPWSTHTPLVPFTTTSSTESTFQTRYPFSSPVPSTQVSAWTKSPDSGCVPQCTWTNWFDADFPNPGPRGGDFEVYAVLREVGFVFCEQPKDIQCRSEKEPDRPLETLEQVVLCDVRFGLICKNINQTGPLQYCDNYHVRFLCCDNTSHCATSPKATPSTVPSTHPHTSTHTSPLLSTHTSPTLDTVTSSPVVTLSTHTSPVLTTGTSPVVTGPTVAPSSTSETLTPSSQVTFSISTVSPLGPSTLQPTVFSSQPFSPSPCFCQAFGQLFLPGDVIYNKTDGAGCQLYAICNQYCDVDRFQGTCPSSSPPVPSTSAPLPPLPPGCDNVTPPRQVNESWTLENCTVARCQGNNQVILLEPEPVDNVTCANKHLPIKVWDQEPCHFHYECECFCSGWGHSHYLTFDGTSYSYLDNCTSVLMREIHPRHGNLSILAHSYYCGATTNITFCPRALSVYYNSMEIVLTITTTASGREEGLIIWDQMWISSGFSKNGVTVSLSGITTMNVNISTIGASITFDGHIFQIWLPYRHFSNNTEGQCGTCTNSQTDDCRRPDGTIASNCQDMAKDWVVPGNSNNSCLPQPSPPPSTTPQPSVSSTPTSTPCPTPPLCELMLSQVFAECHMLIPPDTFFSSCVSDYCNANVTGTPCQSLEAYATLCRARGVCTNWRNATGGLCDLSCPPTKEYRPCGPLHPVSCSSRTLNISTEMLAEGCFCPENQLLFNSRMDICVLECPCVGPDGLPKLPGEQWISNCQSCVCDPSSVSVQCEPVQCESQERPQCTKAGFVTVTRPKADNPCCPETVCVCNATTCPKSPPKCETGYELIYTHEEGSCCPSSSCRPMMCTYNDTLYGVGAKFPGDGLCQTCTCLFVGNQEPKVECREILCTTSCPKGFKYTPVPEQCCGKCVQDACFTPDGQAMQPNETWVNSHVDNCTVYHCKAENGIYILTPMPTACPDVSNCTGTLRKTDCCYSCEKKDSCQVHTNTSILRYQGCETDMAINIPFCEGSCSAMSKYSMEAQAMEHQCTCCQESKVHDVAVTMQCPNGTVIQHTYTHIDECSCAQACRSLPMTSMNTP
ncbi:hypothetical protein STEG23_010826 [Scotinomys teguina]